MTDKANEISALLAPTVASLGLELLGTEYLPSPGGAVLRLYIDVPVADEIDDEACLRRRHPDEPGRCDRFLCVGCEFRCHSYLALVALSAAPPWVRNARVGANSPSLCPTIDSVM